MNSTSCKEMNAHDEYNANLISVPLVPPPQAPMCGVQLAQASWQPYCIGSPAP